MFTSKWNGKKKGLTDPVDIIPFPNQAIKGVNAPKAPTNTAPSTPSVTVFTKPEAKVLTVPTGQLNTSNLSIKQTLTAKDSKEDIQAKNLKNAVFEQFNFDQVKMAWRRYAYEVKEKGMETFYNAMVKRDPKVKEETILVMEVDNQIQIDYITPYLNDLVSFLREELKNYNVSVEFLLIQDDDSTVKFLSGKDRFAAMARKNANLHTLKKVFNLDIEF